MLHMVKEDDDEDWGDDVSEVAIAKRMQELSAGAKGLTFNSDLEKSQEERLEILFEFVKVFTSCTSFGGRG